jgi:hypothetical protein
MPDELPLEAGDDEDEDDETGEDTDEEADDLPGGEEPDKS